jgi:hypothetical protein
MRLPFTADQFFDLFAGYNLMFWPVLAVFWAATLVTTVQLLRGHVVSVSLVALAAAQWAWTAVAYHAMLFTSINPAAWLFAALFLAQAAGLCWFGLVRRRMAFALTWRVKHVFGAVLLVYSLLYPMLATIGVHQFPRAPLFGVPCPLTLFTAGLLLASRFPTPRWLYGVPILWSAIGGSAALLLGVVPDLMLWAAGAALLGALVAQEFGGVRAGAEKPAQVYWRSR